MYCVHCGKEVSKIDLFCGFCGKATINSTQTSGNNINLDKTKGSTNPNNSVADADLLKVFVGESKKDYYIEKWKKGDKQTFNFAAFLASIFWLGYRKMFKLVFGILILLLLVDTIIYLIGMDGEKFNIYLGFGIAGAMAVGGNSIYMKFAEKEIRKLKKLFSGDELIEKVKLRGGGSWRGFCFTMVLFVAYGFASYGIESVVLSLSNFDNTEVRANVQESINQLDVSLYFPPVGLQRTYIEYGSTGNNMIRNDEVKFDMNSDGNEEIYIHALGGLGIERVDQFEITQNEIRRVYMINALINMEVNILELTNRKEWKTGDGDNSVSSMTGIGLTMEVPAGMFTECIEVTNFIEGDIEGRKTLKYYAPKVGIIKTVYVNGKEEFVSEELQSSNINNFSPNNKAEIKEEKDIAKKKENTNQDNNEDVMKSNEGRYLLPESHLREMTQADINNLSNDEINLARNEIFARHGYVFDTSSIQQYFEAQSWYKISREYDGELTSIETANVNFLKEVEEQKKRSSSNDFNYLFEFDNQHYSFSFPLSWKGKVHHSKSDFEGEEAIAFQFQNNGTIYQDAIFFLITIKGDPSAFELNNLGNSYTDITKINELNGSHFYYISNIGDPTTELMKSSVDTKVIQEMISQVSTVVRSLSEALESENTVYVEKSIEKDLIEKAKMYFDNIGGNSSELMLYPPEWVYILSEEYYEMNFSDGNSVTGIYGDSDGNLFMNISGDELTLLEVP